MSGSVSIGSDAASRATASSNISTLVALGYAGATNLQYALGNNPGVITSSDTNVARAAQVNQDAASDIAGRISNMFENINNTLAGYNDPSNASYQSSLAANAQNQVNENMQYINQAEIYGISLGNTGDTSGAGAGIYQPSTGGTTTSPTVVPSPSPQAGAPTPTANGSTITTAGASTSGITQGADSPAGWGIDPVTGKNAPIDPTISGAGSAYTPTPASTANGSGTLQQQVLSTNAGLTANAAFINGAFEAFLGRPATAAELSQYVGKNVGDARTAITQLAQTHNPSAVDHGTNAQATGTLTAAQAAAQGLQQVLNPDQLKAFSSTQIIRDNAGGIYLNPATTTQAQRDAVAAGKTGAEMSPSTAPIIDGTTSNASALNDASGNVDPAAALKAASSSTGDPTSAFSAYSTAVNSSFQAQYDSYTKQINDAQAAITANQADQSTLMGRIAAINSGTSTDPTLVAAQQAAKAAASDLQAKQAALATTMAAINTATQQLNLGIAQIGNKLAPMGIIGGMQKSLQQQATAQIGALQAVAALQTSQDTLAQDLVNTTAKALTDENTAAISTLQMYLKADTDGVTTLTDEEKTAAANQVDLLKQANTDAQTNANQVFTLIQANPAAAVKAGVTLSDSPAVALSKMAPYMSSTSKSGVVKTGTAGGGSGGSGSTAKPTKAQMVSSITNALTTNNLKGSDGLVSWQTYQSMQQNWTQLGGSAADFKIEFPIAQYLDAGNQADFLAQQKGGTTDTTSSSTSGQTGMAGSDPNADIG